MSKKLLSTSNSFLKVLLRTVVFVLLLILALAIGLVIGYVVVGKGKFWEVFNRDTWQHIIDFIS